MKWLLGTICALGLYASGCTVSCSAIGCDDTFQVDLEPEISTTYDVTLVFDGEAGAFTCELGEAGSWVVRDVVGAADGIADPERPACLHRSRVLASRHT